MNEQCADNLQLIARKDVQMNKPDDMKNPEELKKAKEAGVFTKQCPQYVLSAGKILESIISSE